MKRIFLAITLVFISFYPILAQDSRSADTDEARTVISQKYFVGKVSEIDAMLAKGSASMANQAFLEVAEIMQRVISENLQKMRQAKEEDRSGLNQIARQQDQLYVEAKTLSVEMIKNHKEIVKKLHAFGRTL